MADSHLVSLEHSQVATTTSSAVLPCLPLGWVRGWQIGGLSSWAQDGGEEDRSRQCLSAFVGPQARWAGLNAQLELPSGRCGHSRPLSASACDCQVLWKSASGESNLLP